MVASHWLTRSSLRIDTPLDRCFRPPVIYHRASIGGASDTASRSRASVGLAGGLSAGQAPEGPQQQLVDQFDNHPTAFGDSLVISVSRCSHALLCIEVLCGCSFDVVLGERCFKAGEAI